MTRRPYAARPGERQQSRCEYDRGDGEYNGQGSGRSGVAEVLLVQDDDGERLAARTIEDRRHGQFVSGEQECERGGGHQSDP